DGQRQDRVGREGADPARTRAQRRRQEGSRRDPGHQPARPQLLPAQVPDRMTHVMLSAPPAVARSISGAPEILRATSHGALRMTRAYVFCKGLTDSVTLWPLDNAQTPPFWPKSARIQRDRGPARTLL